MITAGARKKQNGETPGPRHRELTKFPGATRRDRTGDLLITNQPLYQLS